MTQTKVIKNQGFNMKVKHLTIVFEFDGCRFEKKVGITLRKNRILDAAFWEDLNRKIRDTTEDVMDYKCFDALRDYLEHGTK